MRTMKIALAAVFVMLIASCKKICEELPGQCDKDLQKGLLAYYPFNGNSKDASGNNNNASPMNGAFLTTDRSGVANRAAGFDGVDDHFLVWDQGKLNADAMSIVMNVLVNNTNRRHAFLSRVNFDDATAVSWGVGQSLDASNKFDFVVQPKTEYCSTPHVYDANNIVSSSQQMQVGRWYNIIVTFGNGMQRMYVDGQLRASAQRNFNSMKKCITSELVIGGWWKNDIVSLDGKLDEVRIYNRVLNECEIDALSDPFQQSGK
jgi:hypothetical protein